MTSNPSSGFDEKTTIPVSFLLHDDNEAVDLDRNVSVEFIRSDPYEMHFACILLPRFSSHKLTGDLANYLPQWLLQVCISHGWRMEHYRVDDEYLGWVLGVPPSDSPDRFMKIIRENTSEFILSNFGHIRRENLSNDFWAPGYMVVSGSKPITEEIVDRYIRLARR